MKFEIRDKEEKKTIKFWLEQDGDSVRLYGSDSGGNSKVIMRFKDGEFYRFTSAQLEGLETNCEGKIQEEDEDDCGDC